MNINYNNVIKYPSARSFTRFFALQEKNKKNWKKRKMKQPKKWNRTFNAGYFLVHILPYLCVSASPMLRCAHNDNFG